VNRLFWKFFFFIWLAQVTAMLCISGSLWLERRQHQEADDAAQTATTKTLINMTTVALQFGGKPAIEHLENTLLEHQIVIVDENNQEIFGRKIQLNSITAARSQSEQSPKLPNPFLASTVNGSDQHRYLVFLSGRHNWNEPPFKRKNWSFNDLLTSQTDHPPPFFSTELHAAHFIDNGAPPPPGFPPPHAQPPHFILLLATAFLASLIFAALLAYYFSKPIATLRRAFAAISNGDLSIRISGQMGKRKDELSDLGTNFDMMAQQFQLLFNSQRQLLHDVSHELRSPLARMHAAIGLARQRPHKIDTMLDRVERESDRMNQLIGELLTLSRVEANINNNTSTLTVIAINTVLGEILDNAQFEAQSEQKSIEFFGNDAVSINGNPELLVRAIENVIRNAVKHTASGTTVRINASVLAAADPDQRDQRYPTTNDNDSSTKGRWLLTVRDQGPGVPEAELDSIFEPFFRSSVGTKNLDGYGLGLAIAKRVISAHGGTIRAFNNTDGGLCVAMSFPILLVEH